MSLLAPVTFDLYALPDEFIGGNRVWPPTRFDDRDARLAALTRLWQGDYSDYLTNQAVPVSTFADYSTRLANLMLAAGVESSDPGLELDSALYDAIVDYTRYGGVLFHWTDRLTVRDPSGWYPLHDQARGDGDVFMTAFTSDSATSPEPDRLRVEVVYGTGQSTESVYAWGDAGYTGRVRGQIGGLLEERTLDPAEVVAVAAEPRVGIWGTSKYLSLTGPTVEAVRRLSENSKILDLFTGTKVLNRESRQQQIDRFDIDTTEDMDEQNLELRRKLGDEFDGDILNVDEDLRDVSFLQPQTGGVIHALQQVEMTRRYIADATGIPDQSGMAQPMSGEALKRQHLPWYAETSRMINRLAQAVADLTGTDVRWPHLFDSDLLAGPAEEDAGPGRMAITQLV